MNIYVRPCHSNFWKLNWLANATAFVEHLDTLARNICRRIYTTNSHPDPFGVRHSHASHNQSGPPCSQVLPWHAVDVRTMACVKGKPQRDTLNSRHVKGIMVFVGSRKSKDWTSALARFVNSAMCSASGASSYVSIRSQIPRGT